jgi:CRISPR-associated RAMP protein (TIGR02581 family)
MLHDTFERRLFTAGELHFQTAFRIGAGKSTAPVGSDLPVVRDANDLPFIPGSSLKGLLRSYIESVVRAVDAGARAACNPVRQDEWCVADPKQLPDWGELSDSDQAQLIYEQTCRVCRAFGSPWLASKVHIRDALLTEPDLWLGQYHVRDGVAINRDTQTAQHQAKYDYEVVPAGTRFGFLLIADNVTDAQIGMLCLGLHAFERGDLSLGGGRSRGLGAFKLLLAERKLFDMQREPERLFALLRGETSDSVWMPITDELIRTRYLPAFRDDLQRMRSREGSNAQAPTE